jgi:hypothetical protein
MTTRLDSDAHRQQIVLAAVLGDRHSKKRLAAPLGLAIPDEFASRFEREVFSRCPSHGETGYLVAFGTVGDSCSVETLLYSRSDPHLISAQARAEASRHAFSAISDVLSVFALAAHDHEPATHISLVQSRITVDHASFGLTPRELDVVVLLALARRPVSTEYITDHIWPEADPWNARSTLKVVVHRLCRRLGTRVVVCRERSWSLKNGTTVDVWQWADEASRPLQAISHSQTIDRFRDIQQTITESLAHPTLTHAAVHEAISAIGCRLRRRLTEEEHSRSNVAQLFGFAGLNER